MMLQTRDTTKTKPLATPAAMSSGYFFLPNGVAATPDVAMRLA